jgi:hypothetical protein
MQLTGSMNLIRYLIGRIENLFISAIWYYRMTQLIALSIPKIVSYTFLVKKVNSLVETLNGNNHINAFVPRLGFPMT